MWNWESVSWLCYLTLTLRLNVDSTLLKSKWQENIPDNEIVQYRKHIAVLDIFLSCGLWNKQGGGCIRAWINYPVADHNIIFPSLSFTTRYCSNNICQSIVILLFSFTFHAVNTYVDSEMVQISYLFCNERLALYLNLFHICEYFQITRFLVKNSTLKGLWLKNLT